MTKTAAVEPEFSLDADSERTLLSLKQPKVALYDIEGTICPISFVKDTLFPYALAFLRAETANIWTDATFESYVAAFPEEARESPSALVAHVEELTAADVKVAYLKNLQGYVWRRGYEQSTYSSPLYKDVIPFMRERCLAKGTRNIIYSSGSVEAQKLLLAYVKDERGQVEDVNMLVEDYFDTVNAGSKVAESSYGKIASTLQVQADEVAFFTDNVREAVAAREAGMEAVVVVRPGNAPLSEAEGEVWKERRVWSFDQLLFH